MLASPDFHASPQQTDLLKFVVNQTLAGNAGEIKGYTVATEVLGRGPDFDQSIDPVVSIQAGRLRRAMERYWLTAGKHDPNRIDIPKGSYVPTFREQLPIDQPIAAEKVEPLDAMATWPTVLVRPLVNLTGNPDDDYLSIGLTAELAHALSHYREIQVLEAYHRDPQSSPPDSDIDFNIDGSIRRDQVGIKVAIRLCDAKKCIQIWSGKYQGDLEAAKMITFQENVAAEIAVRVAGDNATISKHLAGISRNKAAPRLTTYEAMLRFWESDTLLTPQSMVRAIRALEYAVAREPDYGQTWSMLAAQYADNYGLEIVDLATPL
jgi:TolB-like protein